MTQYPKVAILLATYIPEDFKNGMRYLHEQMQSLLNQSYPNIQIFVRDDGSCENALDALDQFEADYPDRVHVIRDNLGNLGFAHNFGEIAGVALRRSDAEYYFFCDHDDVWESHKITRMVDIMQHEKEPEVPLLVYHDASIIDAEGVVKKPSMHRACGDLFLNMTFPKTFFRGSAYGFSIGVDKELLEVALPMPKISIPIGHDYHFTVIAKALGKTVFLDEILAKYRRHGANVSGNFISVNGVMNDVASFLKDPLQRLHRTFNRYSTLERKLVDRANYAHYLVGKYGDSPNFSAESRDFLQDYVAYVLKGRQSRCRFIEQQSFFREYPLARRIGCSLLARLPELTSTQASLLPSVSEADTASPKVS